MTPQSDAVSTDAVSQNVCTRATRPTYHEHSLTLETYLVLLTEHEQLRRRTEECEHMLPALLPTALPIVQMLVCRRNCQADGRP